MCPFNSSVGLSSLYTLAGIIYHLFKFILQYL
nr:MAG TPA: hypothetical protein [Caudoviricetes sp.]